MCATECILPGLCIDIYSWQALCWLDLLLKCSSTNSIILTAERNTEAQSAQIRCWSLREKVSVVSDQQYFNKPNKFFFFLNYNVSSAITCCKMDNQSFGVMQRFTK